MKRYKFDKLWIQITRRCNKKCAHCFKGEAQNLSISKEIIDKLIRDVEDVSYIIFGSGEVLLEIDLIDYFFQQLKTSTWQTRGIEFTTNGTVCDRRIIDILEAFCLSGEGKMVLIRISNDEFHDAEEYTKAYHFYNALIEEANERIKKDNQTGRIHLTYVLEDNSKPIGLIYEGNAINYIDRNSDKYIHGENVNSPRIDQHRIKIIDDRICCAMNVAANGNLVFDESLSYKNEDATAIGNIMEYNISDIIDHHNDCCLTLCSETELWHACRIKNRSLLDHRGRSLLEFYKLLCNRIMELRKKATDIYPHIPASDIITSLPFPDLNKTQILLYEIYANCPYKNNDLIDKMIFGTVSHNPPLYRHIPPERNFDKTLIYQSALISSVIVYLKGGGRKYPYELFGDENEILESSAFHKLKDLDIYYKNNPSYAKNDKIFPCNDNAENLGDIFDIDYREEQSQLLDFNPYVRPDLAIDILKKYKED